MTKGGTLPTQHDAVLQAYAEWVNDALYAAEQGEGDHLVWIGEGRWAMLSSEGPDVFLIEIKRAKVEVSDV